MLSFAVWGIGDMVRGIGRDVIASVGSTNISTSEFRQAYQLQLDNLSRRFRQRLTPAAGRRRPSVSNARFSNN